ncbi:hypothetical protein [Aurantiacibacter rhizosphaerae]|uniref:TIGR02301 family protein n=1 Tax=Aurantiacibacter rhizosphaerae TaxID=2691582 RepID=A0A844XDR1_9SPHN|nr:hypothetical protein [Aurantiacibacter rhizosphaerae]MWV27970.1 hypothetical protein [Aurantiacibacter rhizosphaerae]
MRMRATLAALALGAGLANVPAPALAQSAAFLPAEPQDFQCFTLMQQRRTQVANAPSLTAEQRVEILNNLTIISAFYAGRLSHYSSAEAGSQFRAAATLIGNSNRQQLDAFANTCANFYLSVMELLGNTSIQATNPQQRAPQTGAPQQGQR